MFFYKKFKKISRISSDVYCVAGAGFLSGLTGMLVCAWLLVHGGSGGGMIARGCSYHDSCGAWCWGLLVNFPF